MMVTIKLIDGSEYYSQDHVPLEINNESMTERTLHQYLMTDGGTLIVTGNHILCLITKP